ncbi:methylthioribulose 1-phosphate dehydratase [Candidatus Nitrospira bockiana]
MKTCLDFKLYADQLAEMARWAYRKGWAPGTSTNYSIRLPGAASPAVCAITSSGVDKELIEPEHVVVVDGQGRCLEGAARRPSAETRLHLMLYETVHAGAVLHTHSLPAALLSRLEEAQGRVRLGGWELLKGLQGIETHACAVDLPVFPNSQDMEALAAVIAPKLRGEGPCYGFLLAGHGLYAWGKDLAEAKRHLEVFEFLLECEREVRSHGYATGSRPSTVSLG